MTILLPKQIIQQLILRRITGLIFKAINSLPIGNCACFLSSAEVFSNQLFRKITLGIPLDCQTVWIQIMPDV